MSVKAELVSVLILLLAFLPWGGPLHGADGVKGVKPSGVIQPVSGGTVKAGPVLGSSALSGKASGLKGPLPDLVVSEIGLDGRCRVVVGVRNAGRGPVPEDAFAKGQIRVVAGGRQALIPFGKADPRGALKAPGGAVRVESGLELDRETLVRAEVDGTGQVEEGVAGEKNNERREKLVPRCVAAEGKAVLGARETVKGDAGGPGRVGVKGLSAGSGLSKREGADEDGCPVALEDLALSGSEVVAVLSRQGSGRIEAGEAGRIQLEVRAGTQHRMWPLAQIDPGLRHLNGPGGRVKFETGLTLDKAGPVMGRLLGCPGGRALTRMLAPSGEGGRVFSTTGKMNAPRFSRDNGEETIGLARLPMKTRIEGGTHAQTEGSSPSGGGKTPGDDGSYAPDPGGIVPGGVGTVVVAAAATDTGGEEEPPRDARDRFTCWGATVVSETIQPIVETGDGATASHVIRWQSSPTRRGCHDWTITVLCNAEGEPVLYDFFYIEVAEFDSATNTHYVMWRKPSGWPAACDLSVTVEPTMGGP